MGFGLRGLGFTVQGLGPEVFGASGFRVWGLGFRLRGVDLRIQGEEGSWALIQWLKDFWLHCGIMGLCRMLDASLTKLVCSSVGSKHCPEKQGKNRLIQKGP